MEFYHYIALSTLFIILTLSAFYNGLVVKRYNIDTSKGSVKDDLRVVVIADLHNHIYGENQSKLISKINREKPDIILLAGDICDEKSPVIGAQMFFGELKNVPVYYVFGNHEFKMKNIDEIRKMAEECNINLLEDSYKQISVKNNTLIIAGINDPMKAKFDDKTYNHPESADNVFRNLKNDNVFKILIAHRPDLIDLYKKYPFNLVVSGHSHGGQVRIPFILNGLFSPNQGFFPKYAGGIFEHDSLTHIISRGVSYYPILPRVFNPPEIVVINIRHNG